MTDKVSEPKNKNISVQLRPPRHHLLLARFQIVDPRKKQKNSGSAVRRRVPSAIAADSISLGSVHTIAGPIVAIAPNNSPKQIVPGSQPLLKYLASDRLRRMPLL